MTDGPGYKETILIVDDSGDNRLLLSLILRKAGYDVIEAMDGKDALKMVSDQPPDLILLDIMMPGMDGYEVCQRLKQDDGLKEIPVIFLSALGETEDKIHGLEIGGADYITKPFNKGETLARIRSHLKIRRLTKDILAANRDLREKQKQLDEDLQAAAGIQISLLPKKLPATSLVETRWKFVPSKAIGGDIFNAFPLDEQHFGFYILDVSGHGVPSSLVTVSVSQVLQPHSQGILKQILAEPPYYRILSPQEVMDCLDRDYPIERFDKFFTIFYGIIHMDSDELIYSSAGHPPAILLRKNGAMELLEEGGPIIGMGRGFQFDMGTTKLSREDKLILYTDGVAECQSERGEFYGMDRFLRTLTSLQDEKIGVILDRIVEDLRKFCGAVKPADDITLLGMAYGGRDS